MLHRIDRIETKMMQKELYNYQRISEEIEKKKEADDHYRIDFEHKKKLLNDHIEKEKRHH